MHFDLADLRTISPLRPRRDLPAISPPRARQVLQLEVGVLRDDPSVRVWLQRAADAEGVTPEHISYLGVVCLEQHKPELGRRAPRPSPPP